MTKSKEVVYALIPNSSDAELRLLDKNDNFPSKERLDSTFEGTLHAIGSEALKGGYLTVAMRQRDIEATLQAEDPEADSVIAYRTQPLGNDVQLQPGYKWGIREESNPTK